MSMQSTKLAGGTLPEWVTFPKPGDRIGGKYRIESELGRGGMGAVFEASHEITQKRFAIKVLLPELTQLDAQVQRFIREAQVAGHFQHPNVVEVYDIGQDGDAFFMVMELLHGESLAARLEREQRLGVRDACRILIPCLEGVAAAHAAGIIHRDLKPANIFLCPVRGRTEEQPKVLDFGISKFATLPGVAELTKTDTGAVMGTPYYMAPEQLRSWRLDARVDVYALGVTLYEMLSGRHPFEANTYPELVLRIAGGSPVPIESLASDMPNGLGEVVRRAMARRREDRFPTIEAMGRALEPYAGGRPEQVPTYASPQKPAAKNGTFETTERTSTPFSSESMVDLLRGSGANHRRRSRLRSLLGASVLALLAIVAWRRFAAAPHASRETTQSVSALRAAPPEAPLPAAASPEPATTLRAEPLPNSRAGAVPPPSAAEPARLQAHPKPEPAKALTSRPRVGSHGPATADTPDAGAAQRVGLAPLREPDRRQVRPKPTLGRADF
jgi:serine/threonine-protein kinase